MPNLRLAIADDHPVLLDGLRALLADPRHGLDVVLTAGTGAELVDGLRRHNADLVLLDLNMPGGSGLDYIVQIGHLQPHCKVVIYTMYDQPKFIKEAFKLGAEGYILKDTEFQEMIRGLRAVSDGQVYLSEGLSVFPGVNGQTEDAFEDPFLMFHSLTKRELEILTLISKAKSNKEIAEELYISDQTVSVHRKNLMRKLRVSNSAGLIKFFVEQDLFGQ